MSGAHLYGFPSPDSDYNLRGVHYYPWSQVVGLETGQETIEVSCLKAELQIDLVTHEVKKFFGLLLKRNGYVLEQLYSPLVVQTTDVHDELKEIAKNCITRYHAIITWGLPKLNGIFLKKKRHSECSLCCMYTAYYSREFT